MLQTPRYGLVHAGVVVRLLEAADTELAVKAAMEYGAEKITILGATQGNRLDHLFGNVLTMMLPQKE